ncbi:MAG TPA: DNA methyltransferase [Dehalococcoidia bacterium]|nr:DNA methyltransferase [Dehalococcoidia bacterium]
MADLLCVHSLPLPTCATCREAYDHALTLQEEIEGQHGYDRFLASKTQQHNGAGPTAIGATHPMLFPFQSDITRWAVRKGQAAIFADTGLGKTLMQLEWARLLAERTLIVAPLSVARQTVGEAEKIGLEVRYVRQPDEIGTVISITNYEMAFGFDAAAFGAIVLDESSILKAIDGKTRRRLIEQFGSVRYRLCCTATPAPNDIAEIANHAEFLSISTRANMLATFFVHDDEGWRLKRHAVLPFYKWLASWGMSLRKPSDLGYSDEGFALPKLTVTPHWVEADYVPDGMLFSNGLKGVGHRAQVRRGTIADRVARTVALIGKGRSQWIAWCGLNDEGRALARALGSAAVPVEGSDTPEHKLAAVEGFQDGRYRVLVSKPRISGFGLNLQNAHNMVFVGLSDSWEQYYQCIRRCWRYGQKKPVNVHVVLSHDEAPIYENVLRKDAEAQRMSERLIEHVRISEEEQLQGIEREQQYETAETEGPNYRLLLGDSSERLAELAPETVDLSVFSPPFLALYTYTPSERDVGNCGDEATFLEHFGYIIDQLMRVTKPGRNCAVHIAQVTATLAHDGWEGLKDLRGMTIGAFQERGWIYHGEVCIDKDPQAQAIRTHSKALLFVQLRRDASWLRPGLADYILVFRKPGKNAVPIHPDITNDQWIEWARPIWYGIRESDTLNVAAGRANDDERHIAPLQLGTIERVVRLWSNPGELVLSPFAGIGSEGYVALQQGRRFVGIELKRSYYEAARGNLERASAQQALPL